MHAEIPGNFHKRASISGFLISMRKDHTATDHHPYLSFVKICERNAGHKMVKKSKIREMTAFIIHLLAWEEKFVITFIPKGHT